MGRPRTYATKSTNIKGPERQLDRKKNVKARATKRSQPVIQLFIMVFWFLQPRAWIKGINTSARGSKQNDEPIRISTRILPNRPSLVRPHPTPPTPCTHTPIDGTVVRRERRASPGSPRLRSIVPFYLIPRLQRDTAGLFAVGLLHDLHQGGVGLALWWYD